METQVLEMLDLLELVHVKLELVVEVELLHLILLEFKGLLVVLVKQVI
jgi:hypothetical protein